MKTLKQVIHYPDTNSIEATWIDRIQLPDVEVPEVSATEAVLDEEGNVITSAIEAVAAHMVPGEIKETVIRCHSYADVQMDMFRADVAEFGGDITEYEELIALVEANIKPIPHTPQPILSCSPWQMRKKLNKENLRKVVEDYVLLPDTSIEIKDGWEFATEFSEDDPLVIQMAALLQVSNIHTFIEDALTL